jgi:prolyl-tRNA editing enzyme YbaK/EbsC (Cys-tRNA(Pro) deacylase)
VAAAQLPFIDEHRRTVATPTSALQASTRTAADAAAAIGCEIGAIASSLVFMAAEVRY